MLIALYKPELGIQTDDFPIHLYKDCSNMEKLCMAGAKCYIDICAKNLQSYVLYKIS